MLKKANPDGRFWIKIDGTDVKTALMELMLGKWNGDVDLGDWALEKLRKEYDKRPKDITALTDKASNIKAYTRNLFKKKFLMRKGTVSCMLCQ